jgi:hypothetical protein
VAALSSTSSAAAGGSAWALAVHADRVLQGAVFRVDLAAASRGSSRGVRGGAQAAARVQNHIGTVHAIALCNLAELCAGLVTDVSIPRDMRWIPQDMTVRYLRKAKGRIVASARPPPSCAPRPSRTPRRSQSPH